MGIITRRVTFIEYDFLTADRQQVEASLEDGHLFVKVPDEVEDSGEMRAWAAVILAVALEKELQQDEYEELVAATESVA